MGLVRGRMSSFVATRMISIPAGLTLKISCVDWETGTQLAPQQVGWFQTNLSHGNQVRHGVEVVRGEVAITPGPDFF